MYKNHTLAIEVTFSRNAVEKKVNKTDNWQKANKNNMKLKTKEKENTKRKKKKKWKSNKRKLNKKYFGKIIRI